MNSQTLSAANGRPNPTTNGHRPSQSIGAPATTARPSVIQMLREADAEDRAQAAAAHPPRGFSPQQIEALSAPLNRAHLSSREQGKGSVSYLKSWVVLNEANRIFGFDGWQRQTLLCQCVYQAERLIGDNRRPGWGVTYIARVRVTVAAGAQGLLIREGTGAGHGIDTDLGLAHESALKEAETDAMKRALVTFGNPFGLALYDKSQRQVTRTPSGQGQAQPRSAQPRQATPAQRPQPQAQRPPANSNQATQRPQANGSQPTQRPQAQPPAQGSQRPLAAAPVWHSSQGANPIAATFNAPPRGNGAHGQGTSAPQATARPQATATRAPADSAPTATRSSASTAAASANGHQNPSTGPDALLEPAIALQLQEQLKALSPRHRDAFSRAFRAAFRVPDSTPSVAGLIRQERHRIWIQEFLAKATRG
ncbi:MAG: Rad52/Rad22 family DNA repair protein [Cyanobacteriota bacterium]